MLIRLNVRFNCERRSHSIDCAPPSGGDLRPIIAARLHDRRSRRRLCREESFVMPSTAHRHVSLLITILVALIGSTASAQVSGGTISGTITDSSGAAIPNATVEIRNAATDVLRSLSTNDAGFYSVPNLVPGAYSIRVSAPGFAIAQRTGVSLTVGAELALNFQLRIGDVNEVLEIRGDPPAVETTNATLSGVVD